jgi:AcrR family transcriptional regulator
MTTETRSGTPRFRNRRKSSRLDTRRRLLETAGEIFAEKGFAAATGVDICKRARINTAAINYHFGGMDGLYEAVLIEARDRLPRLEAISALAAQSPDPPARLRAIIELAVGMLAGPQSQSWVLRVLGREAIAPSPAFERLLLEPEGLPKMRFLKTLIGEIMGLPQDHPAVARGCLSVVAPCQIMLVASQGILKRAYPDLGLGPAGAPELIDHLVDFSLAGLAAVAAAEKAQKVGQVPHRF